MYFNFCKNTKNIIIYPIGDETMFDQHITIYKSDANWADAAEADAAVRAKANADIIAFYENSRENGNLVDFTIQLDGPHTLRYTRSWSEAGWTAMSSRQAEFNTVKSALEADGYTITVEQPSYL